MGKSQDVLATRGMDISQGLVTRVELPLHRHDVSRTTRDEVRTSQHRGQSQTHEEPTERGDSSSTPASQEQGHTAVLTATTAAVGTQTPGKKGLYAL